MVWSYVRPGCVVYQWDVKTRSIANKLDCSNASNSSKIVDFAWAKDVGTAHVLVSPCIGIKNDLLPEGWSESYQLRSLVGRALCRRHEGRSKFCRKQ
ncbi:hypothetical protein YQE_09941, partial [Dendroctonus ponderosae]